MFLKQSGSKKQEEVYARPQAWTERRPGMAFPNEFRQLIFVKDDEKAIIVQIESVAELEDLIKKLERLRHIL